MYLFSNSAVFLNIVLQASGFWLNSPPLVAFWSPGVCALVYKFCTYCAKILCTDACLAKVWVTVPVRKRNLLKLMSPQYPKYWVLGLRAYLKYRVIPVISGYPLPDDFQNWIRLGRVPKMMPGIGLGSGTRWALIVEFDKKYICISHDLSQSYKSWYIVKDTMNCQGQ